MFEILFHYHQRLENGKYDNDDHVMRKTLGKKEEDVLLEKVAGFIVGQLARRDICVFDVECFEFVKRQVTFRETKDGIVIKNKKFALGGEFKCEIVAEEDKSDVQESSIKTHALQFPVPQGKTVATNSSVSQPQNKNILRYELFAPDIDGHAGIRGLTKGKKYGIVREVTGGMKGEMILSYIVVNDHGLEQKVDPMYFTSEVQGLHDVFNQKPSSGGIVYGGELVKDENMTPMVRR